MIEVEVKLLNDVKFELGARSHTLICDQPASNGGNDEGMTPPELFLGGLATCAAVYTSAWLKKKGLPREGVSVKLTAEKAGPPARLDQFRIAISVPVALSEEDRTSLDRSVHLCLIHNTLQQPPTIEFTYKLSEAV